ncbi:MAG: DUF3545 family protein [Alteromonadaceae bacterium]|nr:DUF3545 family protein [Alteromonadaceae bacterium]
MDNDNWNEDDELLDDDLSQKNVRKLKGKDRKRKFREIEKIKEKQRLRRELSEINDAYFESDLNALFN